jgi:hypothetical protein
MSYNIAFLLTVAATLFLSSCARSQQAVTEVPPSAPAVSPQPEQTPNLPPPDLIGAQEAAKRVFKDAALIDTSRKPHFIVGDFNGDLSQDIAVILKPALGRLPEMNEEYQPWIIRELLEPLPRTRTPPRVEQNDVLLAIIHGYGPNGWRDPQATQTYLLKNAAGSQMVAHSQNEFVSANSDKKLPKLQGDLIGEVIKGTPGYVYYTGATYAWYDPKTFKGEPEKRLVHPGVRAQVK